VDAALFRKRQGVGVSLLAMAVKDLDPDRAGANIAAAEIDLIVATALLTGANKYYLAVHVLFHPAKFVLRIVEAPFPGTFVRFGNGFFA
jgi:hypothetical protein